jgi:hypothetical protein
MGLELQDAENRNFHFFANSTKIHAYYIKISKNKILKLCSVYLPGTFLECIINVVTEDCDEFFLFNRQTGIKFKSNCLLLNGCTCSNFQEIKTI